MKTKSFSPASVTPDASWVGFSPVSALAGVSNFPLEHDLLTETNGPRPSNRRHSESWARCNGMIQLRVASGFFFAVSGVEGHFLSAWANGLAPKPMEAPDRRGELVSRSGHAGSGGNPHALTIFKCQHTVRGYATPVVNIGHREAQPKCWVPAHAGDRGNAASSQRNGLLILSAWRNAKTQGEVIRPKSTVLAENADQPTETDITFHAGSNPAALTTFGIDDVALKRTSTHIGTNVKSPTAFNRESSVRIRPGYASRGVKVTALKMTPENGPKRVSGHWSKAVALFGSVLFAFASVAMGDPGHGTDLNRMNHANALFSALSQVESGDNDRAIGPKGERTRYQILPAVWKRFGGGANPVEPVSALRVAELVMRPRVDSFIKTQGRPPSAQEWYLLWHCPARVMSPRKSDTQKAERFANLVK